MSAVSIVMGDMPYGDIKELTPNRTATQDGYLPKPPRPNGLKLFNIDGNEVWAINEKNAIRKANKNGKENIQL